jgi:L-seryl-tRNA(Ser) seleniumtransferase
VIAGRADLVASCERHPLARALRPGSLVLGALQELALSYLRRDGDAIPFWRMATTSVATLRARAEAIAAGRVVDTPSVPGGGTLPGVEIPSVGIALDGDHTATLRAATPPIIARVERGETILDLRTVDPAHDGHVAAVLAGL